MIGIGGYARYRLGNMLKVPGAQIVALCDPSGEMIDQARKQLPELASAPSFALPESMYAAVKVDAVVIQSPHKFHFDQIIGAFDHGCHVCCEKPLVANVEQANKVIAARDKAKKVGMVSYQRHMEGPYRLIREIVESKRYGEVRLIQALLCQDWKRLTKGSWRQSLDISCGGQLNDSGSHMIDILMWSTMLEPEVVMAACDNRGTEVDINSSVIVRFRGGAQGSLCIMGDTPNWNEDSTISLDEATIYLRGGKLTIHEHAGRTFTYDRLDGIGTPDQHFIEVIQGKAQLQATFEDALKVARLTQAAWESAANGGQPVTVA